MTVGSHFCAGIIAELLEFSYQDFDRVAGLEPMQLELHNPAHPCGYQPRRLSFVITLDIEKHSRLKSECEKVLYCTSSKKHL
jgi:hypothetical protein